MQIQKIQYVFFFQESLAYLVCPVVIVNIVHHQSSIEENR